MMVLVLSSLILQRICCDTIGGETKCFLGKCLINDEKSPQSTDPFFIDFLCPESECDWFPSSGGMDYYWRKYRRGSLVRQQQPVV
jgi:hypothetical protein